MVSKKIPIASSVFLFFMASQCCLHYETVVDQTTSYRWDSVGKSKCLSRNFVIYEGSCRTNCPSWHVRDLIDPCSSSCISVSDCLETRKFVIYDDVCVPSCPEEAIFIDKSTGRCVQECPINSVQNGTNCLSSTLCTDMDQKVYNRSCVNACPREFYLDMAAVCYASCPENTVSNGSLCVKHEDCILNSQIFNGTCVQECPDQARLILEESKTCVSTCPDKMVSLNRSCIRENECIEGHGFVIHDSTCVEKCPSNTFIHKGLCKTDCPASTYIDGNVCADDWKCINQGQFVYNKSCIEECPKQAPNRQYGYCVSVCSDVVYNNSCITEDICRRLNKFIYNKTCVMACPRTLSFSYNSFCDRQCPNNTLIYLNLCISENECRRRNRFIYNKTCVDSCPSTHSYINYSICLQQCPGESVSYMKICVSGNVCTGMGKVMHNKTCVQSCPDTHPYIHIRTSKCKRKCPDHTVYNSNKCISEYDCKELKMYIYNKSCVSSCPDTHPFIHSSFCDLQCPDGSFSYHYKCISEHECTVAKQSLKFKGNCIKACPRHAPFLQIRTKECFSKCPIDTVLNGSSCTDETFCTGYKLIHNNTCVDSCPVNYPYNASWVCHEKCPHNTFPEHQICRPKSVCINSGRYMHEGNCIGRCFYPNQYINDGDCVAKCPIGTTRLGVFCKAEPCSYVLEPLFDGKECIVRCDTIEFEGGCIEHCPHEYFRYQDGCRELPNKLHTVCIVILLIMICIGTLVLILTEPGASCKQGRKYLEQKPAYDNPCFAETYCGPELVIAGYEED